MLHEKFSFEKLKQRQINKMIKGDKEVFTHKIIFAPKDGAHRERRSSFDLHSIAHRPQMIKFMINDSPNLKSKVSLDLNDIASLLSLDGNSLTSILEEQHSASKQTTIKFETPKDSKQKKGNSIYAFLTL
jgi:hypothetical protein